jgi:hypothetical protein
MSPWLLVQLLERQAHRAALAPASTQSRRCLWKWFCTTGVPFIGNSTSGSLAASNFGQAGPPA